MSVAEAKLTATAYFEALFAPVRDDPSARFELRKFADPDGLDIPPKCFFFPFAGLLRVVEKISLRAEMGPESQADYGFFYGLAPRVRDRGRDEDVEAAVAIGLDFDGGPEVARKNLSRVPWSPSAVIHTGHGLHGIWLLDKPWRFGTKENYRRVLKALAVEYGADRVATNASRVLRIPGTWNLKYEPVPVVLEKLEPDLRYDIQVFLQHVQDLEVRATSPKTTDGSAPANGTGRSAPAPGCTRYGQAALAGLTEELRTARAPTNGSPGERNVVLNKLSFRAGQLVAGGHLDGAAAQELLVGAAVDRGLDSGAALRTWESGFNAGLTSPDPKMPSPRAPNGSRRARSSDDANAHGEASGGARSDSGKQDRDASTAPKPTSDWSQDSLALDMTRNWGDARHVALWGKWLLWTGSRWEMDERLEHLTRTRTYLRARAEGLLQTAPGDSDAKKAAKTIRTAATVAAVAGLARSNAECAAGTEQWDRDPWLLGTPEGTIDLRTGNLHEARPGDYITKLTACGPTPAGTRSELWENFLQKITADNLDLIGYLQRFAGYSLTGLVREHAFTFGYGTGQNGKGTFLETIADTLGEYAITIPTEILMVSAGDRHPTEIARLRGARLVIGSETEEGKRWAEARIKSLTGGDRIAARFMRQDFFEFDPHFKLFVVGNHMPSLRGVDKAIRRRLHFVPFTVTIPDHEVNKNLRHELKAERPTILRWMIDGCLAWQREGLNPPAVIRDATDKYLDDEDSVIQFFADCGTIDPNAWESSADLWTRWKKWAEAAGEFVGTRRKFTNRLKEKGLTPATSGHSKTRGYNGLRLNFVEQEEDHRYGQ